MLFSLFNDSQDGRDSSINGKEKNENIEKQNKSGKISRKTIFIYVYLRNEIYQLISKYNFGVFQNSDIQSILSLELF